MFNIGDTVAVLHETLKGQIVEISLSLIKIEDEDGFVREYPAHKIVAQQEKGDYKIADNHSAKDHDITKKISKRIIKTNKTIPVFKTEIDLHIEELQDIHTHYTNYEIVQIQMTACRSFIQKAMAEHQKKVVLIHGKGQGVLKSEIHQYLERLSNNSGIQIDYHDASFREYGSGGATEVILYG